MLMHANSYSELFHYLSVDWVTDDLLAKIENDSILSKAFKDPEMTQALAQFQDNPEHTLAAATDKPEVRNCRSSRSFHRH